MVKTSRGFKTLIQELSVSDIIEDTQAPDSNWDIFKISLDPELLNFLIL